MPAFSAVNRSVSFSQTEPLDKIWATGSGFTLNVSVSVFTQPFKVTVTWYKPLKAGRAGEMKGFC